MAVIVTGGLGGIGRVVTQRLLNRGVRAVAYDCALAEDFPAARQVDITVESTFTSALTQEGGLHGLVLCAAFPPFHSSAEDVLTVNFLAAMQNIEWFLRRVDPGAAIVLFSSVAGFRRRWASDILDAYLSGE